MHCPVIIGGAGMPARSVRTGAARSRSPSGALRYAPPASSSAPVMPASTSRPRSVSASSSAPSSTAMFVIHSHTRKTITPPSAP